MSYALVVGLTGGIGSGKSSVCRIFARLGARIIDADLAARQAVAKGTPVLREIVDVFGKSFLLNDGSLDRKKMAGLIFTQPAKKLQLNKIVHPRVRQIITDQLQHTLDSGSYSIIVIDIPLLYETGAEEYPFLNSIVVVTADLPARIRRLRRRDGLSEKEIMNRVNAQLPLEKKAARADYVIDNSGTLDELEQKVRSLYRTLVDADIVPS